jgi:tetratricopeptide (TPR) repeat protein
LKSEGQNREAEKLLRETLEIQRHVLGPEHQETLGTQGILANVLLHEGQITDAEKLQRATLDSRRHTLGAEHPDTAEAVYDLAIIEASKGKRDTALSLLSAAIDHGLSPRDVLGIDKDPDLKSLHGDPGFEALVIHARDRVAISQKAK